MIRSIQFMNQMAAQQLQPGTLGPCVAMISITDPGQPSAELSSDFWAICRVSLTTVLGDYPAPHDPAPHMPKAQEIVNFVASMHDATEEIDLVVHCYYGQPLALAVARYVEKRCKLKMLLPEGLQRHHLSDGSRGLRQLLKLAEAGFACPAGAA